MPVINIWNPEEITRYLERHADAHPETIRLLDITLTPSLKKRAESAQRLTALPADAPAWLQNKFDTTGPYHTFEPDDALFDKVRHVKDWLVSAQLKDEHFLKDLDKKGRPKKLVQLDLDGAYNAADKYFEKLNQKFRAVAEDDGNTKTVMTFEDGSRIVQLLTPNALKPEGASMGHCIGGGSYDYVLLGGTHKFYSLRDANNKPHATFEVEVDGSSLLQCRGKENKPPAEKYMPMVQEFVMREKFALQDSAANTHLLQGDDDVIYSIFSLPDRFSTKGNIYLSGCTSLTHLPDGFSAKGGIALSGCTSLTHLPDDFSAGEAISLIGCASLTSIPRTIKVKGDIYTDLGTFKTVDAAADAFELKFGKPSLKPAQKTGATPPCP